MHIKYLYKDGNALQNISLT